jgi:glycosyltransferase involved in cell wall biosynthesis
MQVNALKDKTIVHVTTAHCHDDVRIFHRQARLLVPYFKKVCILAAACENKSLDGVEIVSWGGRIPISRKERVRAVGEVLVAVKKIDVDLLQIHDPELLLHFPAYSRKQGIKIIYDVHENYRATLYENSGKGLKGFVAKYIYGMWERSVLNKIDGIVTVTDQIADIYRSFLKPVALVRNYPDTNNIIRLTGEKNVSVSACNLLYSSISLEQKSLYPLASALLKLEKKYPNINVTLVGDFKDLKERDKILDHYKNLGVSGRLKWIKKMERNDFLRSLPDYSIGLTLFWPLLNVKMALPNKLFEYMAGGLPVIVPDCPNQREVVENNKCGCYCDTRDACSIESAIDDLLANPEEAKNMGLRGREACKSFYNMEVDLPNLMKLYEQVFEVRD